jgi:hypothetical protein
MLERIVAQVALALFGWLETRAQRNSTAVDADRDLPRLRSAGSRVRDWLREQDRIRSGGKSDAGRASQPDARVSHGERRVDALEQPDRRP